MTPLRLLAILLLLAFCTTTTRADAEASLPYLSCPPGYHSYQDEPQPHNATNATTSSSSSTCNATSSSSSPGEPLSMIVDCYPPVANKPNATAEFCWSQGCCFRDDDENNNSTTSNDNSTTNNNVSCAFPVLQQSSNETETAVETLQQSASCQALRVSERMACRNPLYGSTTQLNETECNWIGCCYDANANERCFQPQTPGYKIAQFNQTTSGWSVLLELYNKTRGPFGNDIRRVHLTVSLQSQDRVRLRLTDPEQARYEVPDYLFDTTSATTDTTPQSNTTNRIDGQLYNISFTQAPFGVAVTRVETGHVLFNSTPPETVNGLIYENQFLQITTALMATSSSTTNSSTTPPPPPPPILYGLGEGVGRFWLNTNTTSGQHYTLFSRDQLAATAQHTSRGGQNIYGVHPFYMQLDPATGNAHGVWLRNSNAMEMVLTNETLTFRTVGGILDFYFFLGPSPQEVVQQYTAVVGRPQLPPYWALGFHLCKWGYKSVDETKNVVQRMRAAGMPQDVQWNDIDYMDRYLDFTLDPVAYKKEDMQSFVKDLHSHNQRYVNIIDPGISSEVTPTGSDTYSALESGKKAGIFIKSANGKDDLVGRVWPGWVVFPDFMNPNATEWWYQQLNNFYSKIPFDGAWIDMNEPSNFCNGERPFLCRHNSVEANMSDPSNSLNLSQILNFSLLSTDGVVSPFDPYRQPYVPGQIQTEIGGKGDLDDATVSMAAHQRESLHYNVHSLYGHAEMVATTAALEKIREKRAFVLSRSTFAGSGASGAHWLGDNNSSWVNLRESIAGTLQMNMFGIPFVGADVCGFLGNATAELCVRWHQLGAFYPFMRNHNHHLSAAQAPVDFDEESQELIKQALMTRYSLLPHLYTLLFLASTEGTPAVRPLVFEFPNDAATACIDTQFLWGRGLLISPATRNGQQIVEGYFPDDVWYDYWTGMPINGNHTIPGMVSLEAPLSKINLHIRGGTIVATQKPETTTTASRQNGYGLVIAMPANDQNGNAANGSLYIDDGESLSPFDREEYALIEFVGKRSGNSSYAIQSEIVKSGYHGPELLLPLSNITILAHPGKLANLTVYLGDRVLQSSQQKYDAGTGRLMLTGLDHPIGKKLDLRLGLASSKQQDDSKQIPVPSGQGDSGLDSNSSETSGSTTEDSQHQPSPQETRGGHMLTFFSLFMFAMSVMAYRRYGFPRHAQFDRGYGGVEYEMVPQSGYEMVGEARSNAFRV